MSSIYLIQELFVYYDCLWVFFSTNICIMVQIISFVRGSEKISHMSEILGIDFFGYLDARELPKHFAF